MPIQEYRIYFSNKNKYLQLKKILGGKDVTREILYKLDNKDVLNFCLVDKRASDLCDDEFFHIYLMRNYPNIIEFYKNVNVDVEKWKKIYLKNVYYMGKLKDNYGYIYTKNDKHDASSAYIIITYMLGDRNNIFSSISNAILLGDVKLLDYLIYREIFYKNDIIIFCLNDLGKAKTKASTEEFKEMLEYLLQYKPLKLYWGAMLSGLVSHNQLEKLEKALEVSKGHYSPDFKKLIGIARRNKRDAIEKYLVRQESKWAAWDDSRMGTVIKKGV